VEFTEIFADQLSTDRATRRYRTLLMAASAAGLAVGVTRPKFGRTAS